MKKNILKVLFLAVLGCFFVFTAEAQAALKIGVVTDTHYDIVKYPNRDKVAQKFIDVFNAQGVEMVMGLGDHYEGGFTDLNQYLQSLSIYEAPWFKSNAPVHWTLGNHDLGGYTTYSNVKPYSFIGAKNYFVDLTQGWRVIFYSNVEDPYISATGATLLWLKDALEQARMSNRKVIIAIHGRIDQDYPGNPPVYLSGLYSGFSYNANQQRKILESAKAAGTDIRYVFQGHTHSNAMALIGGITYYTFIYAGDTPSAAIVTIENDNTLKIMGIGSQSFYGYNNFYVDVQNGSDNNFGLTRETAWATLAKASIVARDPGMTITVLPGIYREQVVLASTMKKNLFTTWNFENGAKVSGADVIDANSWIGPDVNGWYTTLLPIETNVVLEDGVVLKESIYSSLAQAGKWDWNAGILYYRPTSGLPLGHLVEAAQRWHALQINSKANFLNLKNAEVYGCKSMGIWIKESPRYINLYDIKAWGNFTGLYIINSPPINPGGVSCIKISRVIARNNKNVGIGFDGLSDAVLSYALVYDNDGSGISIGSTAEPRINNVTLVGNKYGLYFTGILENSNGVTIKNLISHGNKTKGINALGVGKCLISYADINDSVLWGNIVHSDHVFSADPLFANLLLKDFRLQAASSCRNSGVSAGSPPNPAIVDVAGTKVPQESVTDIGAYEYKQ